MARKAKQVKIVMTGQPFMGDLFARLIAEAIANRPQITLVASDGQLVDKKQKNKRS